MSGGLIVPNELVGWWCPSLDATGSLLVDRSRRNNHGTLTNMDPASDWVVSGGKLALDFDASNDYVETGRTSGIREEATVSAWLNPVTVATYQVIVAEDPVVSFLSRNWLFGFGATSGQLLSLEFVGNSVSVFNSASDLLAGSWQHVAWRRSRQGVQFFINGRQSGSTSTYPGSLNTNATPTTIGRRLVPTDPQYLGGQLDDIRIYNRALTAGEVRQLWQIGRGNMPLRRRRRYTEQAAGFRAYWARNNSRLIGAGNVS
jgi:hypothetical protein